LDSADTPAVFERTYSGTADERGTVSPFVAPNDVSAYTSASGGVYYADYIESGYEQQAGSFFVRARLDNNGDGIEANNDGEIWDSFIINYAGADVTEASGEIWDIDGGNTATEKFTVTVTGDSASVTDGTYSVSEISPTGLLETNASSLDGKPWQFAFGSSDGFTDIDQIEITRFGDGSGTDGYKSFFPLAFNNFNPVSSVGFTSAVPEPSTLAVFAVGSVGIVAGGIRRRRKQKA
jgi:hypothetical protein